MLRRIKFLRDSRTNRKNIIDFNNHENRINKLPYIDFPEFNLKILVDTGATTSFINPDIANNLWPKNIKFDPITVSNCFTKSRQNYSVQIPIPKIFKLPNKFFKFHMFKFHRTFKGLIGMDNLKKLKAKVDFENNLLVTPLAKIPLKFQNLPNTLNTIKLEPLSETQIQLRVGIKNGEIIIPQKNTKNTEIPECLTIAKNGYAFTTIKNFSDNPISVNIYEPVKVLPYNKNEFESQHEINFHESEIKLTEFDPSIIRTDHMSSEERHGILKLCSKYASIFHLESNPLPFSNRIRHTIKTVDEIPVYTRTYRYPFIHRTEVQNQINKMLDSKIIRPSSSPWSSPIWVVPKKLDVSGKQKWRIVIDYRKLNDKTIDDKYPLPNINDLLDKLGRCQYFSTLDLASGYHQIEMNPKDVEKTAFNTENGHFEFLRMPFGLKNAPATFQRVIDNVLRGLNNEICLVYLDDIIVFSVSLQEHLNNLEAVFQRLKESNLKVQLDKSEFLKKEISYLGHIVTPEGIRPNPEKIRAIQSYPIPSTTKQIKGFLGLLGYYRKFIKNFAKLTKPLTKCLKKNAKIIHDSEFVECFQLCKKLLTDEPILQYPDFDKPFNITTDASNVAIGAVLSQGPIGRDLPIAYTSRTLNDSETNYSTIEKELLAVVYAVKYFRPYVYGKKFTIITDHKPLQWLFSIKDPHGKLMRWRLKLSEYDYDIVYKKGKLNANADALSRVEIHTKETATNLFDYVNEFNKELANEPSTSGTLDNQSLIVNTDESEVVENATQHSNADEHPIIEIPICEKPVNYGSNQIIITRVKHSPAKPKIKNIYDKQRFLVQLSENKFKQDTISFIKQFIVPKVQYYIYFEQPHSYEKFCEVLRQNFKWPSYKFTRCNQFLTDVDKNDVNEIINKYHTSKTNHRGINETHDKIKSIYYWPNMKNTIQKFINECEICQVTKYERHPLKFPYNITPVADHRAGAL